MKFILYTLLFITPFIGSSQDSQFDYAKDFDKILRQTQDKNDSLYFPNQILRYSSNDTSLTDYEVLALLIGFTADSNYKPYNDITTERKIYSLNGNGKFEEAKSKGLEFIKTHPLNQKTLIELSYTYHKLGIADSADYYSIKFHQIMDAMALSGKGFTADSAFFSLTPVDGQNFITKYLRGKVGTMGSGSDTKGNFVDILEYIPSDSEDGEGVSLYFQIEHTQGELKSQIKDALNKRSEK
jgi:hypothetical protein